MELLPRCKQVVQLSVQIFRDVGRTGLHRHEHRDEAGQVRHVAALGQNELFHDRTKIVPGDDGIVGRQGCHSNRAVSPHAYVTVLKCVFYVL